VQFDEYEYPSDDESDVHEDTTQEKSASRELWGAAKDGDVFAAVDDNDIWGTVNTEAGLMTNLRDRIELKSEKDQIRSAVRKTVLPSSIQETPHKTHPCPTT
jgi:hypothetical protein